MKNFLVRLSRLWPIKEERPEVTFDRIIGERQLRYRELRAAVVKILFLRNKLEGDLLERRAEIARIHAEARTAARSGQDRRAVMLLDRMHQLKERLADAEGQVDEIKREANSVAHDMARVNESIRDLEREKRESLARLTNAEVRRKLKKLLDEGHLDKDNRRLERVRMMVARAQAEAALDREIDDDPDELIDPRARIELARMKARLLPA
jgi:phage shock protein A